MTIRLHSTAVWQCAARLLASVLAALLASQAVAATDGADASTPMAATSDERFAVHGQLT